MRNRRVIVHANPQADGSYAECAVVGPGEMIRLRIDDIPLDPIPYEDVMRLTSYLDIPHVDTSEAEPARGAV